EELEAARREVTKLQDQGEQLQQAIDRMSDLELLSRPKGPRGDTPPASPTEARLSLLEFRRRELARLHGEKREMDRALERAVETLDELEVRFHLASSARQTRENELRKAAVVRLRVPDPATVAPKVHLAIEYLVPGARWAPAYNIAFDSAYSHAKLAMRALVCQRSGEDWDGVDLTLSTANAMAWTELPELPSMRIGRRQPSPPRAGWREPPAGAEALYADYDHARKAAPLPPPPEQAAPEPEPVAAATEDDLYDEGAVFGAMDKEIAYEEEREEAWDDVAPMKSAPPEPEADMAVMEMSAMPSSAPPPPPAPKRRPKAKKDARRAQAMPPPRGGMVRDGDEEPEELELAAPADLLRYGRLRLGGPEDPHRGKLRPASSNERYREMLAEIDAVAGFSVATWIREERRSAAGAADVSLPAGYAFPATLDGFDYAYKGEVPVDVPSDGAYHTLPMTERSAETRLLYIVVPRESTDVFRSVSLVNPWKRPLLNGPADISIGGDYAITTPLRTVAPSGEMGVGLGAEEGIKVARNTTFAEHASGLLGGHLNLEHTISIEVANNLKRPVDLEVRERIPAVPSEDDQIEVEITETSPAWEKFEQKKSPIPGAYRWCLEIGPGAKKTLKAVYVVGISSKKELQGGNRRES
ncbi:MAG: DUF4139 domain-containing protein, partial [Planctomycetota bacterium]